MGGLGSLTGGGSLDLGAGPATSGDAKSSTGFNFGGINNARTINNMPVYVLGAVVALWLLTK